MGILLWVVLGLIRMTIEVPMHCFLAVNALR